MIKRAGRLIVVIALSIFCDKAYGQQDVQFHLIKQFFPGKNILRVKRDYKDPYLWVLAQNNTIYRINSITQQVDDYTSYFSSYNNLQFADIAGYSQDTVFVSTNTSTLLELKNGSLKTYGISDGISGNIIQIGVSSPQNSSYSNGVYLPPNLYVPSTTSVFELNVTKDQVIGANNVENGIHTLFETTYRNQIFRYTPNPDNNNTTDSAEAVPLNLQLPNTLIGGYIWYKLQAYGYNINTAYCLKSYYPDNFFNENYDLNEIYDEPHFLNNVYGTEKGIFVDNRLSSFNTPGPYNHYMDGININKITSIYGLGTFPQLIKENLLIGTNQGLYFSNSSYQKYDTNNINYYNSFTLENDIGNKIINDICVDANSYIPRPAPYQPYEGTICENGVWVATVDGLYFISPDYTSYINGTQVQAIYFNGKPVTDAVMSFCEGSTISASALINKHYYNGNGIQWYKDDVQLNGQNSDTLKINAEGNYRAVLYDPCQNIHLQSNVLKVNIIASPQFVFNYPDKLQYCDSTSATLNVTYNSAYHYRWYQDGVLNGDTTASLTVMQNGKYKVQVSACTNSWVPSKEVQLNFIQVPVPVITTDKPAYCIGDNATLSLSAAPGPYYTINWYRDNTLLSSYTNLGSITTNVPGTYTAIITSNTLTSSGTTCGETSNAMQVVFNAKPSLTIQQQVNTTLCDGQTVTLKAIHSDGTVKWSTGETGDQVNVTASGTYTATLTSTSGCIVDTSTDVAFLSNPVFSVSDTTICTYQKQTVTLTAPSGYSKYEWNNVTGAQTYDVTYPQTVSLTVTDANGCQATRQIHVTSQCPEIFIPNTFTPNGDGINDVWDIQGLDVTATVKIFNRYGTMLYQSKGYAIPWDGSYENKKLPNGTYYYIIKAKNGTQTLSGSVTVLY